MRTARIKETAGGYYHVVSRVVDRRMVLNDKEKERFRIMMRRAEAFSGVQVLTYAFLNNHFHILLHVPPPSEVDDSEFAHRLAVLYDKTLVSNLVKHLAWLRGVGQDDAAEAVKKPYLDRMYDLSEYMKTLKQRVTQSFNRRHGRKGTLWEERFKSILVEGRQGALSAVAAYIDLNPVRAGIVADPRDYRFSGYGEAIGGSRRARRGLAVVMPSLGAGAAWNAVHGEYRKRLYVRGAATGLTECGTAGRQGFSHEQLQRVLDSGGKLSLQQALHCRVRYFTDGVILGSRAYVDDAFCRYRDRFSPKRTSGARRLARVEMGDLCTVRRLQLAAISVPAG